MSKEFLLGGELQASPDLDRVYRDPSDPEKEFHLPTRLDLMVTGACPMRCAGCWGPRHNDPRPELGADQWLKIIRFVDMNNRSDGYDYSSIAAEDARVCITGGEPLLYDSLLDLVQMLKQNHVHTTLSTTGIDPAGILPEILKNIDEVGIPIDGPDSATNALWRVGKVAGGGLEEAIRALLLAQERPDLDITIRTLIHPGNASKVSQIPELLAQSGVDISRMRWKLYFHNSGTGPRQGITASQDFSASPDDLEPWSEELITESKLFGMGAYVYLPARDVARLIIGPTGESRIILGGSRRGDVQLGNIAFDPVSVLRSASEYPDFLARANTRTAVFQTFAEMLSSPIDPKKSPAEAYLGALGVVGSRLDVHN